MRGSGNVRGVAPESRFRGDPMAALDRLPPALRRAIHEGLLPWDPCAERWKLNRLLKRGVPQADAVDDLVRGIRLADQTEAAAMRCAWPSRFGVCPAIAANATILRYDEAERVRARRKRAP